ncbi:MAG TPA: NUDIX domain-containing protein [Patescibacteria group bacterium]|nr:NUDIX domain-containing protein [Patescibacteria group bacterium]
MKKQSAGILLYKKTAQGLEVLLVHPGGPFWAKRDLGSWSIPKGEFDGSEQPLEAAKREFSEEVGLLALDKEYSNLGQFKQPSGKIVSAFACNADFNLELFKSNMFTMEWPPKSGQQQEFPECDKAAWLSLDAAKQKIIKGQIPILEALASHLGLTSV